MTKAELLEALKDYPDDTPLAIESTHQEYAPSPLRAVRICAGWFDFGETIGGWREGVVLVSDQT